ncbi:unnamed protein product [Arctia plantaginis]|uniref:Uncharacterized protein n=1 Tax=Arctia plantaginis TaxID=874455 RepID=A0A8S1AEF6_ARCPL|nr:unnamed protein product [Arctia plantaginis]
MLMKTIIFAILAVGALAQEFTLQRLPSIELKNMLTTQCQKNGAEDKVDEVENSGKAFVECVKGLIDVDTLKREIEEARPNGALDEVFKKYCAKTPQLKSCIHNLLDGVTPCVDTEAKGHITEAKNATDLLIDFVCYKDGDRIALFIAEGGPQCFQSKVNEIKTCGDTLKNSVSSVEEAKNLTIEQRCAKYDELVTCVVGKLETCDTPTPSNMFESLAKYVRNSTPCPVSTTYIISIL